MRLYQSAGATYPGEGGNSRANTYHWLSALSAMGTVDASVTADHPLYAVFKKGNVRTYAAYNMRNEALTVTFSDGDPDGSGGSGASLMIDTDHT